MSKNTQKVFVVLQLDSGYETTVLAIAVNETLGHKLLKKFAEKELKMMNRASMCHLVVNNDKSISIVRGRPKTTADICTQLVKGTDSIVDLILEPVDMYLTEDITL